MARKLKSGQKVRNYTVGELINTGAFAISYSAVDDTGSKVFFKQYKSPSCTVPWYKKYVDYQQELKRRIEANFVSNMAVGFIDMFEEKAGPLTYFQVFEFVEGGQDLSQILEMIKSRPSSISWEQRVIFAKVMIGSIQKLHEAKIIHCDLKPENLQLFPTGPGVKAGYRLKLIDMDFSILSEQRAPWHGIQGYVGTPGYLSPEHLTEGAAPVMASDIFTCGLIMCELLSEAGHPYRLDESDYKAAVFGHRASRPRLVGNMPGTAVDDHVSAMIHKCLSPDPADRPTAGEILDVLNGRGGAAPVIRPEPKPLPSKTRPTPSPVVPKRKRIVLTPETGEPLSMGVRTEVGKYLCKGMGAEAQFLDRLQFTLEQKPTGEWQVNPNTSATNETMLNGNAVIAPTDLKEGDVLGVGREAKGVVKLRMKISFV